MSTASICIAEYVDKNKKYRRVTGKTRFRFAYPDAHVSTRFSFIDKAVLPLSWRGRTAAGESGRRGDADANHHRWSAAVMGAPPPVNHDALGFEGERMVEGRTATSDLPIERCTLEGRSPVSGERQREFLVTVMVHAGCFLERRYGAFTARYAATTSVRNQAGGDSHSPWA
jgi:hypothetical protein